jgi:tetratricopeptide (TPR) repeat protein
VNVFKKSLILIVLFLHGMCSAQAYIGPAQTKRERMQNDSYSQSADSLYAKMRESFVNEDYASADKLAVQYLSLNRGKTNTDDVLYLRALSLIKLGRMAEARDVLASLESSSSSLNGKASASASFADTFFYENQYASAYDAYERTMAKYPYSDQTVYLHSRLSELSARLGKTAVKPLGQIAVEEAGIFSVQVGSFSHESNAKALSEKLSRAGFDAFISTDAAHRLYRVRVGKASSHEDAVATQSKLKKAGYSTRIYP